MRRLVESKMNKESLVRELVPDANGILDVASVPVITPDHDNVPAPSVINACPLVPSAIGPICIVVLL